MSCGAKAPATFCMFMAGERDIRETAEALRKHHPPGVEILPLYARLSADEQQKVFQPHGRPRIVLATNVAETSLTVPGIKYVIDPGFARISRYTPRTKVQRLPIERISRASRRPAQGPLRPRERRHLRSGSTARRISSRAPRSPSRKFSGRTSPASSCR